ncbi:hypothetical protein GGX14DRAFT_580719 [Mycena pura]|uniref:Uncharacterized protein n=1 Tax=Mycena pura TaxID=153505 RepID=A0AAD6UK65_9AGAR|nr:hypothetical protein GGX14DRAFT_580719 [Mycena pura]
MPAARIHMLVAPTFPPPHHLAAPLRPAPPTTTTVYSVHSGHSNILTNTDVHYKLAVKPWCQALDLLSQCELVKSAVLKSSSHQANSSHAIAPVLPCDFSPHLCHPGPRARALTAQPPPAPTTAIATPERRANTDA